MGRATDRERQGGNGKEPRLTADGARDVSQVEEEARHDGRPFASRSFECRVVREGVQEADDVLPVAPAGVARTALAQSALE